MAKLFLFVLLITILNQAQGQEATAGIYITIKVNKNKSGCPKELFAKDKKIRACVPIYPIISVNDFISLTVIKNDERKNFSYFSVQLSEEGFSKLKDVTQELPGSQLAFVVNETIVGFIKNISQITNKSIQVDGKANSEDVKWVHQELKKIIKLKN